MNRSCDKKPARFLVAVVGALFVVAGTAFGLLMIQAGLVSYLSAPEPKTITTNLLGLAILIFCIVGLPKGACRAKAR